MEVTHVFISSDVQCWECDKSPDENKGRAVFRIAFTSTQNSITLCTDCLHDLANQAVSMQFKESLKKET